LVCGPVEPVEKRIAFHGLQRSPSRHVHSAISSGSATRPSGIVRSAPCMRPVARLPGVSTQPGATALTVMASAASSTASERVIDTTAAFAAL
jgi:hypothetical protein